MEKTFDMDKTKMVKSFLVKNFISFCNGWV
jgi:hypothetical protein